MAILWFTVCTFTCPIVSLLMFLALSIFVSVDAVLITDLRYFCQYIVIICDINYKTATYNTLKTKTLKPYWNKSE